MQCPFKRALADTQTDIRVEVTWRMMTTTMMANRNSGVSSLDDRYPVVNPKTPHYVFPFCAPNKLFTHVTMTRIVHQRSGIMIPVLHNLGWPSFAVAAGVAGS